MYSKDKASKASDKQLTAHFDSLKKDNVGVEERGGKYWLNIARKYSRLYFKDKNGKPATQKRIATGISIFDSKGKIDKDNANVIDFRITWINNDLLNDRFDPELTKYGFLGEAQRNDEAPPKKQKSLLELYDWYCESRVCETKKGLLSETYLKLHLQGDFRRALVKALDAGNTEALDIRNYLINNYYLGTAKSTLSTLERAYNLGIRHGECNNNPFMGIANEIKLSKRGKSQPSNDSDDNDEDNDKRSFTPEEMNAIIEYFETPKRKHLAPIIKFLFWTGCRTGEAIGLKWRDIKWDKEVIVIRRTYNHELKIFKPTKTKVPRWFPMPKDKQLWNLLKSLPEGKPDEVVFKAKNGGITAYKQLSKIWIGEAGTCYGAIKQLMAQGKVSQYLKLYATRHTFITHQIQIHKIPREVVASWCGHDEEVTKKSYLDRDRVTMPGESATTTTTTPAPATSNDNIDVVDMIANLTPEKLSEVRRLLLNQ